MRIGLAAAAALATLAFAMLSTAYADSHYGPIQNGDKCWHRQLGDSLGYWSACTQAQTASRVVRTNAKTTSKKK